MRVGLLGHGVVGSGVCEIIDKHSTKETESLEIAKILVKNDSEKNDPRCTVDVNEILEDPSIDMIVECMGGIEPAHTFIKRALENGKHAVTSNKKMLANSAVDLFGTASESGKKLLYEATTGGGIPWIAEIRRTRRIDRIVSFEGIFNGTTNYILSRMDSEQKSFDEMLKEAQALGYAEKDPSDDIDGMDVRYKTMLSALSAFDALVDPEDIITYGIRSIAKEDLDWARSHGMTVRLVGRGNMEQDFLHLSVMPVMMKRTELLANVNSNFNAIGLDSKTLGRAVFYGQGAGSLPTAHAVVQDMIDIACGTDIPAVSMKEAAVSASGKTGVYYVRTEKSGLFSDAIDQRISENAFITKKMSLADINMIMTSAADPSLFAAEVQDD
jgi:homoserine dehydrogenase